ncbi:DUF4190 domain-containing protein [Nocardia uniformis]|uniref:DUF4190 domain-containing protein n=1 Tax=Nocardia uniformis TaxID=53432 RepID=A0A849CC99_9NOCA|nr:DUF4190 domain-containing protein [Nocardia uniformis]NNH75496.1 DUF4190 domain-containing protein [Nocardia uniformis]
MSYPPYGPYQGYPAYGYGPPPEHPQATTIMVLGIVGLVFCQLLGPVAWIMGSKAKREIAQSGGMLGGHSSVTVGYICGIVATCFLMLAVLVYGVVIAIAVVGGSSSGY